MAVSLWEHSFVQHGTGFSDLVDWFRIWAHDLSWANGTFSLKIFNWNDNDSGLSFGLSINCYHLGIVSWLVHHQLDWSTEKNCLWSMIRVKLTCTRRRPERQKEIPAFQPLVLSPSGSQCIFDLGYCKTSLYSIILPLKKSCMCSIFPKKWVSSIVQYKKVQREHYCSKYWQYGWWNRRVKFRQTITEQEMHSWGWQPHLNLNPRSSKCKRLSIVGNITLSGPQLPHL